MNHASKAEVIIDLHERGCTEDSRFVVIRLSGYRRIFRLTLTTVIYSNTIVSAFRLNELRNNYAWHSGALLYAKGLLIYKNQDIPNDHPLLIEKKCRVHRQKVAANSDLLSNHLVSERLRGIHFVIRRIIGPSRVVLITRLH